jgi:hypothetical protein
MASRKSTGKRLRFEVFKRDHFTCQYCGAQPPDVVLVCDHVTPVAGGGTTTIDNLITACETCNQGKAHIPLGNVAMRPDADMLYLEAQQEVAELRRYQMVLAERAEIYDGLIDELLLVWFEVSNRKWALPHPVIRQLLETYSPEIVHAAIVDIGGKVRTGYLDTYGTKWLNYLTAVARNMASEAGE